MAGSDNHGALHLLKTDADGNRLWHETFDGVSGSAVQQTTDGGYVVAGSVSLGRTDDLGQLIKTDSNGKKEWLEAFDFADRVAFWSVRQISDGGYIVAGQRRERGAERSHSVQQTIDGGYIVTGSQWWLDPNGKSNLFVLKTDRAGDLLWEKTLGGPFADSGKSVQQTSDGGYIVAGYRDNVDERNPELRVYLIKLAADFFRRGDANADGDVNLADPIEMLNTLFAGGTDFTCADAADTDDSGEVNLTDAVLLLNYLFSGGFAPNAPFLECGVDSTLDELSCDSFPSC